MTTQDDVERFLNQFHTKLKIYDIIFRDDRGKNLQALAELDITSNYRLEVIKTIQVEDYSEGPIANSLNQCGDLWVFGKDVKGHEVYIKISLGIPNNKTICISFHKAEYNMSYPFKKL
ncbi:MAG: toxin [Paludibacteraceae bacterium]|nr:toxin [Paludibacteraceae bacterium]